MRGALIRLVESPSLHITCTESGECHVCDTLNLLALPYNVSLKGTVDNAMSTSPRATSTIATAIEEQRGKNKRCHVGDTHTHTACPFSVVCKWVVPRCISRRWRQWVAAVTARYERRAMRMSNAMRNNAGHSGANSLLKTEGRAVLLR